MARHLKKPPARPGLMLTPRDALIIRAVYRYRFLSTDQIQLLTGTTSRSKLNDRLRELWGNDYLDRPEYQRELFAYADKRPTVHALGTRGAEWLTQNHHVRFPKTVDWRAKNKHIKSGDFIHHTLGVTETMLQVERDVHAESGLRVIDREEVWLTSPSFTPNHPKPYELPTTLTWKEGLKQRRNTKPDYLFGIADNRGERPTRGLHFLEYDRGTENFVKRSASQSSILQKLSGYADAYERKLHEQLYGYKRFRVLFVIEGDERRIDNMIAVYQAHIEERIPAGAFLFTTVDAIKSAGFLAPIWRTPKAAGVALLPPLTPAAQTTHPARGLAPDRQPAPSAS